VDQFKLLALTLMYCSRCVLYNQNKHKNSKPSQFLEITYVFNSSGQCTSATGALLDFSLSYSHHEAKSTHTIVTQFVANYSIGVQTA